MTPVAIAQLIRWLGAGAPPEEISQLVEQAAQNHDVTPLRGSIERWLQTLAGWEFDLRAALEKVDAFEARVAARSRYGQAWWDRRRRELELALRERPDEGFVELARTFADAIAAGETAICREIADHDWPPPQDSETPEVLGWLADVVDDVTMSSLPHLLERLGRFGGAGAAGPALDASRQAAMFVFSGRVLLHQGYPAQAELRFRAAAAREPRGLSHTGLGDLYRETGSLDEAFAEYQLALEDTRNRADTFIGLGLTSEARGLGSEAREWYEEAVRVVADARSPVLALGAMLPEVPGGALLALAELIEEDRPEDALIAVDRALVAGVDGLSGFAPGEADALSARLRERSGDAFGAAKAHANAGYAWLSAGDPARALAELEAATTLEPALAIAHFGAAEALRLRSYGTPPQPPDRDLLSQSIERWERAYELEPPPADTAWVYASVGAALAEFAPVSGEPLARVRWRAVDWLERGIVVSLAEGEPPTEQTWLYLAALLSDLGLFSSALAVTTAAVAGANAESAAWLSHGQMLANLSRFDEALDVLDRSAAAPADSDELRIYISLRQGDLDAGFAGLDRIIDASLAPNLWAISQRAEFRARAGDAEGSRADFKAVLKTCGEDQQQYRLTAAYAAYRLGELDTARALWQQGSAEPSGFSSALSVMGALGEARAGELSQARRLAVAGLRWPYSRSVLSDLLEEAQDAAGDERLAAGAREEAAWLGHELAERAAVAEDPSPREELEAMLELSDEPTIASAVWMALGRTERELGRWREANEAYRQAARARPGVRESTAGIRVTVDAQRDALVAAGTVGPADWAAARALCEQYLPDGGAQLGRLTALEGAALILSGEASQGAALLRAANELLGEDATAKAAVFANAYMVASAAPAQLWQLRRATIELGHEQSGAGHPWEATVSAIDKMVQSELRLLPEPLAPADLRPIVRIGGALIAEDHGPTWALFADYVPALRARIEADTGVSVPGIFFQPLPDQAGGGDGRYEIELDGFVQVFGTVELGHRFSPLAPDNLVGAGIAAERMIPAPDPLTGRIGAWVEAGEAARLSGAAEPWPEPLSYVVRQLEIVLRANLGSFIDADRVEVLLDRWSLDPAGAACVEETLRERADRTRFGRLIQELASEMVPIADWRDVLLPLGRGPFAPGAEEQAVAAIRARLGDRLPGRARPPCQVVIPAETIAGLRRAIRGELSGGTAGFPAALRLLRDELATRGELDENAVIVTPDAAGRKLLRRLLLTVLPHVPVLEVAELLASPGARDVKHAT